MEKGTYYIKMESYWLRTYVTYVIGDLDDCFLAGVDGDYYFIKHLVNGSLTYIVEMFYNVVVSRTISAAPADEDVFK